MPSSDDLYLNDGNSYDNGLYFPDADEIVAEADQQKKAVMASSYPVMDDVADWFKEQIENTDSVQFVKSYAATEKVPLEDALRAFDIARTLLEAKAMEFSEFGKERDNG